MNLIYYSGHGYSMEHHDNYQSEDQLCESFWHNWDEEIIKEKFVSTVLKLREDMPTHKLIEKIKMTKQKLVERTRKATLCVFILWHPDIEFLHYEPTSFISESVLINYITVHTDWIPIAGDFNGDGIDTMGLYDSAKPTVYLRGSNIGGSGSGGIADITFAYGKMSIIRTVNKWNERQKKGLWKQIIAIIHKKKAKIYAMHFFPKLYEKYKETLRCKLLKLRNDLESVMQQNQLDVLHEDNFVQDSSWINNKLCSI